MDFHVTFEGRQDLSGQVYRQLRAAILDRRLRPGEALPPTRELARRLSVSRNTVSAAYDRLAAEGFVAGRVGAGTFVAAGIEPGARTGAGVSGERLRPLPVWDQIPDLPDLSGAPRYDFRAGLPDARLFPYETWRRLVVQQMRASAVGTGMYGDPAGHTDLRAAVARFIAVSRAVRATAEDIFVTNGTQQACDLIGRVLLEPGATVAVESPGYLPVRRLFRALGARIADVPVDDEGLVVDEIPADARIIYVSPSHQFPLGMPMSLPRRLALLDWADRHGSVIIEDDYDSEFRFGGRPIEPLQNLDRTGLVLYVGSFSKVMLPTLRLGFLVAPPSLHSALRKARYVADWHTPLPVQLTLARFIDEGSLARHIRKMRNEYRARHERIEAILSSDFGRWLRPIGSVAGIHMSAVCLPGVTLDTRQVVDSAAAAGVGLNAIRQSAVGVPRVDGLILGYGAIAMSDIDEGLQRLRQCVAAAAGPVRGA